jgi:hypothetical protein
MKLSFSLVLLLFSFSASGQSHFLKSPATSNIYPDTFAVYWRVDLPQQNKENIYSVGFELRTMFDDLISVTEPTTDSIVTFLFDQEYNYCNAFILNRSLFANNQPISIITDERIDRPTTMVLKMVSRNDKIEVLKSLVETRGSLQNLRLLADAYEDQQCFVNACYIYYRMMYVDLELGEKYFNDYYLRNFNTFNGPRSVR